MKFSSAFIVSSLFLSTCCFLSINGEDIINGIAGDYDTSASIWNYFEKRYTPTTIIHDPATYIDFPSGSEIVVKKIQWPMRGDMGYQPWQDDVKVIVYQVLDDNFQNVYIHHVEGTVANNAPNGPSAEEYTFLPAVSVCGQPANALPKLYVGVQTNTGEPYYGSLADHNGHTAYPLRLSSLVTEPGLKSISQADDGVGNSRYIPYKITYDRQTPVSDGDLQVVDVDVCSLDNFCNMWTVLKRAETLGSCGKKHWGNCQRWLKVGQSCNIRCPVGSERVGDPYECTEQGVSPLEQQYCSTG
jgi:hypothetical protein